MRESECSRLLKSGLMRAHCNTYNWEYILQQVCEYLCGCAAYGLHVILNVLYIIEWMTVYILVEENIGIKCEKKSPQIPTVFVCKYCSVTSTPIYFSTGCLVYVFHVQ